MKHLFPTGSFTVHHFVEQNLNGLRHAAHELGGENGIRLIDEITDALSRDPGLSRRTGGLLDRLRQLLSLENVDDEDNPAAAYFAIIDPASPLVEEICLLSDGLAEAIKRVPSVTLTKGKSSLQAA